MDTEIKNRTRVGYEPNFAYHSSGAIGSTSLKTLILHGPETYAAKHRHDITPEHLRIDPRPFSGVLDEKNSGIIIGTMVDAELTEADPETAIMDYLDQEVIMSPHEDFRSNEAKAWRDRQTRPIIKPTLAQSCRQRAGLIVYALRNKVQNLMPADHKSMQVVYRAEYRGLRLQAKLDFEYGNIGGFSDLKTCYDIDRFRLQSIQLGYIYQAAFYRLVSGLDFTYLIAAETKPPFRVRAFEYDEGALAAATVRVLAALEDIDERNKSGDFSEGVPIQKITFSSWQLDAMTGAEEEPEEYV
jgi:hypothetical protein